ncbi:hypothetical protein EUX98_g6175 [Antrodiella citrinella]|uniref:Uncharacterized protein n=1 Tax=Antrodiella citrinella TaxID=2447956 RepID=A0A4S4MPY9_9APHY|nr:hypothetical protein EUX98_g6175 [Antrodiella citrinella]
MNTVFRDGAAQIFDNKKTFTAIKSCYHRNVETFKQIYAFEKYLIQVTIPPLPGSTSNGYVALPPSFDSPADRLAFLDQQLEAARALPIETGVGNLSVRFREDIVSRQIVPLFGKDPSPSLLGKGLSAPAAALFPQPDPPGEEEAESDGEAEAEEHGTPNGDDQQEPNYNQQPNAQASASVANASQKPLPSIKARPRKKTPAAIASNTARFRVAQADAPSPSTSQVQPSPQPQQQPQQQTVVPVYNGAPMANYPGYPPHSYPTAHMYPQPSPHYDYSQAYSPAAYAVHNPQIQHLTQVSQNLVSVVSALVDQLRAQAEDGKALLELMRKREERERANEVNGVIGSADVVADKKERAAVANQVLANPHADEDVRQAARDFLKRLFA